MHFRQTKTTCLLYELLIFGTTSTTEDNSEAMELVCLLNNKSVTTDHRDRNLTD
jgi:hypothetical protein